VLLFAGAAATRSWARTYRALRRLGATEAVATAVARNVGSWWRSSLHVSRVLDPAYYDRLRVPKFS
jgi:hypothetical protein